MGDVSGYVMVYVYCGTKKQRELPKRSTYYFQLTKFSMGDYRLESPSDELSSGSSTDIILLNYSFLVVRFYQFVYTLLWSCTSLFIHITTGIHTDLNDLR